LWVHGRRAQKGGKKGCNNSGEKADVGLDFDEIVMLTPWNWGSKGQRKKSGTKYLLRRCKCVVSRKGTTGKQRVK